MSPTSHLEAAATGESPFNSNATIDHSIGQSGSTRFRLETLGGLRGLVALFAVMLGFISTAFAAVNVNSATKEQLMLLDGIGEVRAQAIIDYRANNGPFKSIGDLINVPGIGEATLKKLEKDVVLSGGTGIASPAVPAKKEAASPAKAKAKADSTEGKAAAPTKTGAKTADVPAKTATPAAKVDAKAAPAANAKAKQGATPDSTSTTGTTPVIKKADLKKAAK